MLRRIFRLTILLASLLVAGMPALACVQCVPVHDCCPIGVLAPCSLAGSTAVSSDSIQLCSTAGAASSSVFAANESSNDFHNRLKRLEVPAILTSPAISPVADVALSRSTAIYVRSSFSPTFALLYLSTGRLRL